MNVEDEEEAQRVLQQMMEQEEGSKQDQGRHPPLMSHD